MSLGLRVSLWKQCPLVPGLVCCPSEGKRHVPRVWKACVAAGSPVAFCRVGGLRILLFILRRRQFAGLSQCCVVETTSGGSLSGGTRSVDRVCQVRMSHCVLWTKGPRQATLDRAPWCSRQGTRPNRGPRRDHCGWRWAHGPPEVGVAWRAGVSCQGHMVPRPVCL